MPVLSPLAHGDLGTLTACGEAGKYTEVQRPLRFHAEVAAVFEAGRVAVLVGSWPVEGTTLAQWEEPCYPLQLGGTGHSVGCRSTGCHPLGAWEAEALVWAAGRGLTSHSLLVCLCVLAVSPLACPSELTLGTATLVCHPLALLPRLSHSPLTSACLLPCSGCPLAHSPRVLLSEVCLAVTLPSSLCLVPPP